MTVLFPRVPVLIRGGGDLGSGVAYRLFCAGFPVIILELPAPILVRPAVSFGTAVYESEITVEGVRAYHDPALSPDPALWGVAAEQNVIPILVDPDGASISVLKPVVVIDARMAKVNLDTHIMDAPLVIALGPGFTARVHCHAVIETNRGHNLGRVIRIGNAEPDTGTPGIVNGRGAERVIRAPLHGHVLPLAQVGDFIREGQPVAQMGDQLITAAFDGMLRGLVHPRAPIHAGQKIGDLDPRGKREHCFTISDKALAIGGGVVEAVLSAQAVRAKY